ncbi:MAG: 50S ribosomal protein L1 [Chlamydiia bacterium]|nr:50S ribosomal protein L1 [Chlamydiia bacterium]
MSKRSKRYKEIEEKVDVTKEYTLSEALEILKKCPTVKFDESVDISLKLGVDPKKSDQQVRGTVALPNGSGKDLKVVVLAKGEKMQEAEQAGANEVGNKELIDKIKGGWTDFDALVATPDMMRDVGKLGKVLGPRGLMPTPKAGTVTTDVAKAVQELKAGKVEFKVDKSSVINNMIGKLSFKLEALLENIDAIVSAIHRAKPSSSKGVYLKSMHVSSTMGPGIKIDVSKVG